MARNSVSPIDQLAGQIDYGVVGSNQDAIASLVGMAMVASDKNEKEEIVQKLTRKLTYPETRDFDRTSRQIRKALFEGILKIRNYDVHTEFINGELKGIDLVGVDARNANLKGIKFNNAFIVGTNFSASNLQSADLTSTDLRNVQFQNANLNGTILSMARQTILLAKGIFSNTEMPTKRELEDVRTDSPRNEQLSTTNKSKRRQLAVDAVGVLGWGALVWTEMNSPDPNYWMVSVAFLFFYGVFGF